MNIISITTSYPYKLEPYNGIFVEKTVKALRSRGHVVSVIKPVSISRILAGWVKTKSIRRFKSDDPSVIFPVYFGLPLRLVGMRAWAVQWNEKKN